jgi:hypothetical protein
LLLQIALDLYFAQEYFKNGDYVEGLCQAILGCVHMHQAIPQIKLLNWKLANNPSLYAELKQDAKGFVYLDIPDDYLSSLKELYNEHGMELPPYFGEGRAGAHVSVILTTELSGAEGLKIDEIGQKFKFNIINVDAVKPDGWQAVNKVHFLTLDCPEIESMRHKYGLNPKIEHHDFHLTFGIEKAIA